jgi:hypothetical protein
MGLTSDGIMGPGVLTDMPMAAVAVESQCKAPWLQPASMDTLGKPLPTP